MDSDYIWLNLNDLVFDMHQKIDGLMEALRSKNKNR